MAKLAEAEWDPSGATPGGEIIPLIIILHVTAGLGDAHPHDGLEWHFEVRLDGRIQQQVDTELAAAANYKANRFRGKDGRWYGAISIETEGKGDGSWTPQQLKSILRLIEWLLATHPTIERRVCPGPFDAGIGYHIMFGTPGYWTPVAKACPGPRRIEQFHDVLMPTILAGSAPAPAPAPSEPEEDDMKLYKAPMAWYLVTGGSIAHLDPAFAQKHLDDGMKPIEASDNDILKLRRDLRHDEDKFAAMIAAILKAVSTEQA